MYSNVAPNFLNSNVPFIFCALLTRVIVDCWHHSALLCLFVQFCKEFSVVIFPLIYQVYTQFHIFSIHIGDGIRISSCHLFLFTQGSFINRRMWIVFWARYFMRKHLIPVGTFIVHFWCYLTRFWDSLFKICSQHYAGWCLRQIKGGNLKWSKLYSQNARQVIITCQIYT